MDRDIRLFTLILLESANIWQGNYDIIFIFSKFMASFKLYSKVKLKATICGPFYYISFKILQNVVKSVYIF